MCRRAEVGLPAEPMSATLARRFVLEQSEQWELRPLADELALLTSELVTNAVLHAGTLLRVMMTVAQGYVEVGVSDGDRRHPRPAELRLDLLRELEAVPAGPLPPQSPADRDAAHFGGLTTGRGMVIVDALSDAWGVAERPGGKEVWFQLAVGDWPYRDGCPCGARQGHPVGSGRPVVHLTGPWSG